MIADAGECSRELARARLAAMGQALKVPPPGFEALTVEEQIDYVQALWDLIAARPEAVRVPDWHQAILDERLADFDHNPDEGVSWDTFRAELDAEDNARKR
jgi:putative addiction module component (TIGR02574 family)